MEDDLPASVEDPGGPVRDEGAPGEHQLWTQRTYKKDSSSPSSPRLTDHVVAEGLEGVPGGGRLVGEVGRRVGVGLGLVEVVHAGEVSPALVPAHLQEESS